MSIEGKKSLEDQALREDLREQLTRWFNVRKRDLPWRVDPGPWERLVSEIMLQQTQADTVIPYYEAFLQEFPEPSSLVAASEEEVHKAWEGLGYYRRARYLQDSARLIVENYGGDFPSDYDGLRALPGVGDYTAGALASFLYGMRTPAVDGNVFRVMTRLLGETLTRGRSADEREVREALELLLETQRLEIPVDAGLINEALIELGALVCRVGSAASCELCPWQEHCGALAQERVAELPYTKAAPPKALEFWTMPLLKYEDAILVHQRPEVGLLASLYEFPMLEGLRSQAEVLNTLDHLGPRMRSESPRSIRHVFSHKIWKIDVFFLAVEDGDLEALAAIFETSGARLHWLSHSEVLALPMPSYLQVLRKEGC